MGVTMGRLSDHVAQPADAAGGYFAVAAGSETAVEQGCLCVLADLVHGAVEQGANGGLLAHALELRLQGVAIDALGLVEAPAGIQRGIGLGDQALGVLDDLLGTSPAVGLPAWGPRLMPRREALDE